MNISREYAYALLTQYITSEALVFHSLSVEAIMRHFAERYGEDPNYWGIVGLLHDLDWEQFPEQHCEKTAEILKEHGYDESFIHAVQSHGWQICTDIEPVHIMEKVLFALDEMSGLIIACVLIRPSKSILDLEVKSVMKKWKQPSFAAGVDRDIVLKGISMLDMELSEAIKECIVAMKKIAGTINMA